YEFREELVAWINRYNQDYPHSSLGYMTPVEFEQKEIKQLPLTRTLNSTFFALDKWGAVQYYPPRFLSRGEICWNQSR
ncbi:MAG TPA: integrase core domain-containing protein, partial [bacterium]|nr:integrase core domain-containing protein [bacterium]